MTPYFTLPVGNRSRCLALLLVWMLSIIGATSHSLAQTKMPLEVERITQDIVIDGVIDEPAWEGITPLPLVMYQPIANGEMTEHTEIRVAYDGTYIYVGARLFAQDPNTVRADSFERDDWSAEGDFMNVVLDAFNDNENAVSFSTTPNGIRLDSEISNDAEGRWLNTSWNGFWDAASTRGAFGWSTELRIPFASLRFNSTKDVVRMGLSINRFVAHCNERYIFPAVEPTSETALWKPSKFQDIVFDDIDSDTPTYITPYVLLGMQSASSASFPTQDVERQHEVGLDVKYSLTNSLTLDVTLNTDFAHVESDDEQVNLTRFSLFYPEKRLFFQERSGLFQFDLGDEGRLLHTRRIGLRDDGAPVRLLGGLRMTGRLGAWDIGLMDMQTAASSPQPSENFGTLRIRRPVMNAYSYVGAMVTNRLGANGDVRAAFGLDGRIRVFGDDYLTTSVVQAFDGRTSSHVAQPISSRLHLNWERRTEVGLGYALQFTRSGQTFEPALGFSSRVGFALAEQNVSYGWFSKDASRIRLHLPAFRNAIYMRTVDGSLESTVQELSWKIGLKAGGSGDVRIRHQSEDVREPFALTKNASVPGGSYTFFTAGAAYGTSMSRRIGGLADVEVGAFYDGRRITAEIAPFWIPSAHLRMTLSMEGNWIHFPLRDQRIGAHVGRLKLKGAIDSRFSAQTFLQYNHSRNQWSFNIKFRYNAREGSDLYVVYNGQRTDRKNLQPEVLQSGAVIVKYTHTLIY